MLKQENIKPKFEGITIIEGKMKQPSVIIESHNEPKVYTREDFIEQDVIEASKNKPKEEKKPEKPINTVNVKTEELH